MRAGRHPPVLDKAWSRKRPFRLLLSCAGRRVELMSAFRRAADRLGLPLKVYAADASWLAPAMHLADESHVVPSVEDPRYIPALLRLVRREKIDMVVPLLDPELPKLAEAREQFARAGALAVISSASVVGACRDKIRTFRFLSEAGIDTPKTWSLREVLAQRRHRFPYFMKPRRGSASRGNYKVRSVEELRVFGRHVAEPIVQEFVPGVEHTLDVYAGFDGVPRCAVPRRRVEVRGGEVVKSIVVKDPRLIEVGLQVAGVLKDCVGVITIQFIVAPDGRIRVIEINPRFGGGAPLAIHAGADFPRWLLDTAIGGEPRIRPDGYRDGECMLRFDESVFVLADSHPPKKQPRMLP